jgi:hypothetical protein
MSFEEYVIERDAVDTYGKESQLIVAIEELSELTKELTKNLRGEDNTNHIYEEMADVQIMLDQLHIIFKNSDAVKGWKRKKLQRLRERLHNSSSDN